MKHLVTLSFFSVNNCKTNKTLTAVAHQLKTANKTEKLMQQNTVYA